MEYVKVAQTSELPLGGKKKISLGNKEILLTNFEGSYYALDNRCPHMGGSLFDGKLEGNHLICPRHGSVFDVKTGRVIERGNILFIKVKVEDLHQYPVKIEGMDLYIEID